MSELTFAENDPPFAEIIGRQFDTNFVTGHDPNKVLAHPTGDVSHHFGAGFELDAKTCVGERLSYGAFDFESFFLFGQVYKTFSLGGQEAGPARLRQIGQFYSRCHATGIRERVVTEMGF